VQDIEGHLNGGIPLADIDALQAYWTVCPQLRAALFQPNRAGYVDLAVDKATIKRRIYGHPEFAAFIEGMNRHFERWRDAQVKRLKALKPGFHPKALIAEVTESLLAHYRGKPLIDAYAVYQHLMDYWAATLQDDAWLIAADGWKAQPYRITETDKKGKRKDKGWACDLIPKPLVVARYFSAEQATLDALAAEFDALEAQLAVLEEEHGGDEAAFSGFDKINAKAVKERLDELDDAHEDPSLASSSRRRPGSSASTRADADTSASDETTVLRTWLTLDAQRAARKKALKEADAALDTKALARYPKLGEAEIKGLVVDDKWLATLDADIHGEMDRVSQQLTRRVKELAERYEFPLPQMSRRLDVLQAKVDAQLQRMGFAWK
jgi:type I restriction enzyme M protein